MRFTIAAALVLASLSSCGQRGPLYLPPPDVPQAPYRPKLPAACAGVLKAP